MHLSLPSAPRDMAVQTNAADQSSPLPEQLVARAEAMIPKLRQRAEQADRDRRLASETVEDLRQAGFFRILQPERSGGYGMRPSVLWEVTRHLGRGCGSTAFVVSLLGLHAWIVGMFAGRAQDEVFANGTDAIVPNLSIGARRSNQTANADAGYVVSGAWGYASGVDLAEWVIAAINVPNGEDGGEERLALIPQARVRDRSRQLECSWRARHGKQGRQPEQRLRSAVSHDPMVGCGAGHVPGCRSSITDRFIGCRRAACWSCRPRRPSSRRHAAPSTFSSMS